MSSFPIEREFYCRPDSMLQNHLILRSTFVGKFAIRVQIRHLTI